MFSVLFFINNFDLMDQPARRRRGQKSSIALDEDIGETPLGQPAVRIDEDRLETVIGSPRLVIETPIAGLVAPPDIFRRHRHRRDRHRHRLNARPLQALDLDRHRPAR